MTTKTFETTVDKIAETDLEIQELEVERDQEIQAIRDRCEKPIARKRAALESMLNEARDFATEHREALLGKHKSRKTKLATYGFRTGAPTLSTLGRAKWDKILANAKRADLTKFIVTQEVIDKIKVKTEATPEELKSLGCRITQAVTFFVKPKDPGAEPTPQNAA